MGYVVSWTSYRTPSTGILVLYITPRPACRRCCTARDEVLRLPELRCLGGGGPSFFWFPVYLSSWACVIHSMLLLEVFYTIFTIFSGYHNEHVLLRFFLLLFFSGIIRCQKSPHVSWTGWRDEAVFTIHKICLLYTSPSPRDQRGSRMPSSA